jgi:hypothetical protein
MDSETKKAAAKVALQMVEALVETVEAHGDRGTPSGHVYAAFAGHGVNLDNYLYLESLALTTGRIEKRGDVLYRTAVPPSSTT